MIMKRCDFSRLDAIKAGPTPWQVPACAQERSSGEGGGRSLLQMEIQAMVGVFGPPRLPNQST